MDLRDRKRIKNGCLPRFVNAGENIDADKLADQANQTAWGKFKTRWNNGGGASAVNSAIGVLGAAQQFSAMKTPSNYVSDFVGKYGTNNYGNIDGISYQQYNDIDTGAEESRMSQERDNKIMSGATLGATTGLGLGLGASALAGATAGSWLGPVGAIAGLGLGALLGGVFGNSAKHEEEERMRIAQIKQNNANEFWRTGALTTALRNKSLEEYGDTTRFNLFSGVKDGAENIHTNSGVKRGEPNAKVNVGEIIEGKNGKAHVVTGNPNIVDGEYAKLKDGDNVYSSTLTIPGTDITYAEAYPIMKALGREDELLALQPISRQMAQKNRITDGLIHAWGGWENVLANGLGLIQSWRDYNSAANDTPRYTNISPYNKYENKVGNLMAGRRISAYPQLAAITTEGAANRYRINQSGGLSAMQKTMANLTNSMGSKIARANALANAQQINNQYAKEYADVLNNMGQWSGEASMKAQMFNEQQNAAANAARTQQMYMAKRNALDYLTQGFKNAWDYHQFKKMYELYDQQVKNETATNNIRAGLNSDGTPKATTQEQLVYPSYLVNDGSQYRWALPQFNWPIKW